MTWWLSDGSLHCRIDVPRRGHKAPPNSIKIVHPALEVLEDRRLFNVNAWLPQRLEPIDGAGRDNPAAPLFHPATTDLLPSPGLQSTTVTASGLFTVTDSGAFSLSLTESGPYGNNNFYSFSESGTVSFSLVELGTFSANGFSTTSVTLNETASLSWSFLVTDDNGHTVSYQSGNGTVTAQGTGAAPFDPYFAPGFNWLPVTQQVSSQNSLNLTGLSATSLSATETGGSDSFLFQESGTATVQGSDRVPLGNNLLQTGQYSYTVTGVQSFSSSLQGNDTFLLTELGQYAGNSYSLSSVTYSESGTQSSVFNATFTDSETGNGSTTGAQSFSGGNHTLGGSASESFQFTGLSTTHYGESATSNYSFSESGTFGGGSFALSSLNYGAAGSGGYSLTQTSLQTQTGTFSSTESASGTDSFGIAGTLTSAGTVTQSGGYTATSNGTLQDLESGNFTLHELGTYTNGSWSLTSFNLSESLSGTFSSQAVDSQTQTGAGTVTDSGTGTDSFLLNFGTFVTDRGGQTVNSTDTQTDNFTVTSGGNTSWSGASSYTLALLGTLVQGSPGLNSYVFSSGQSGTFVTTGSFTSSETGTAQDTASGSDSATHSVSAGGLNDLLTGASSFTAGDSFTSAANDSGSSTDTGSLNRALYLAGVYFQGSFSLSSVSSSETGSDSWTQGGFATTTDSGTNNFTDGGSGTDAGTLVLGGGTFAGTGGGSYSDSGGGSFSGTATDSYSATGSSHFTFTERGTYGGYSYSFGSVVYQANGTSNGTVQETATSSFGGSFGGTFNDNGTTTANGSYAIHTESALGTAVDSGTDSVGYRSNETLTETVTSADSWNVYEAGGFVGGSWNLSSVNYGESFTDTFSAQDYGSATDSGTDTFYSAGSSTGGDTTVLGGGSVSNSGTVIFSDGGSDSFSDQGNQTVTSSGTDTYLLTELGTFGNLSFAFSSMVYQGGDSVTETTVESSNDTAGGTETGSASEQGLGTYIGTYAGGNENGGGSFLASSNVSFQTGGNNSFSGTYSYSDRFTFYQAGQWAQGSVSLSSLSSTETVNETWSFQGGDTATYSGQVTQTFNGGGNHSFQAGLFSVNDSGNSAETLTGTARETATDSFSGGGHDTWSVSEQGTFGNYSASLSCWVYQGGGNQTQAVNETVTDSTNGTRTSGGGANATFGVGGTFGLINVGLQISSGGGGSTSLSETFTSTYNGTVSSSDTWSFYQAGSFSGNSLGLSSFSASDTGSDSWSDKGTDSVTDTGTETVTSGATFGASAGAGISGLACFSLGGTVGFSGTASGTDTVTASDSYNDSGGDTWSESVQGTYANNSFNLSSVVFQGGGTFGGTAQASSVDSFQGGGTVNYSASGQLGANTSVGLTPDAASDGFSLAGTTTQGLTAYAFGSVTSGRTGSYSFYQSGSFAGDSFAFASVNYHSAASGSYTAVGTSSASETFGGSGTASDSSGSNDSGADFDLTNPLFSDGSSAGETDGLSGSGTVNDSVTLSGGDSFSLTALGSYANGSLSLSSYVYSATDSGSANAQETGTSSETLTANGNLFVSNTRNADVVVYQSNGSGPPLSYSLSADGSSTDSPSFTGTVSAGDTTTVTALSTFNESLYQAGTYGAGSFALSSVVFSASSTGCATAQDVSSYTATDTRSGVALQSLMDNQPDIHFTNSDNETYTAQDTATGGGTVTETSLSTEVIYQAGCYANDSYNLSSFSLQEQGADTVTSTAVGSAASAESGSTSGAEMFAPQEWYGGSGTFSDNSGANATSQGTVSESFSLTEQGTFASGSYGLSCYAFGQQQQSSDSVSESGSWTGSFQGVNQNQSYSGTDGGNFSGSSTDSASASLTEQGSYGGGSFNLGLVNFGAQGNNSFGSTESDNSNWSGGYSGSENGSQQANGNGSFTEAASGNYGGGSFSLSCVMLQGGATGSYSDDESDQETLIVSGNSFNHTGGAEHQSWEVNDSGQESDTLYQAGVETAGSYSNLSYSNTSGGAASWSDQLVLPNGVVITDNWQDTSSTQAVGANGGNKVQTDNATDNWQDAAGGGSAAGTFQSSLPFATPGAPVLLAAPDASSVPVAGGEAAGDLPSAAPGLAVVATTGEWLTGQVEEGALGAEPALQLVAVQATGSGKTPTAYGTPAGELPTSGTGGSGWAGAGGLVLCAAPGEPSGGPAPSGEGAAPKPPAALGALKSFEDIVKNPGALYGKSADEVAAILGEGWTKGKYGVTGTGWKFTKGDKVVFYHEGGRHVGPYYGYSSGTTGKVKIVGPGYKPLPGDKAKIIQAPEPTPAPKPAEVPKAPPEAPKAPPAEAPKAPPAAEAPKAPAPPAAAEAPKAAEAAAEATQATRLSRLLNGAKPILGRFGAILRGAGYVALPVGLAWEAYSRFAMELEQQKALKVVNEGYDALEDQISRMDKRLKQGGELSKEDAAALRAELNDMKKLTVLFLRRTRAMDAAAPSDAILVGGTWKRGLAVARKLGKLEDNLAIASNKDVKEAAEKGEAYLNDKLGSAKAGGYWELSTGFSFNLNPMFAFVGGRWRVRWRTSDPWYDPETVVPPWGKGEAATNEILGKLRELNRKLP